MVREKGRGGKWDVSVVILWIGRERRVLSAIACVSRNSGMYGNLAYFLGIVMSRSRLAVRVVSPGDVSVVYAVLRDFCIFV